MTTLLGSSMAMPLRNVTFLSNSYDIKSLAEFIYNKPQVLHLIAERRLSE
jgi:hypothetical protein